MVDFLEDLWTKVEGSARVSDSVIGYNQGFALRHAAPEPLQRSLFFPQSVSCRLPRIALGLQSCKPFLCGQDETKYQPPAMPDPQ